MFEIYGGGAAFKQWTKNQRLVMDRLPVGAEVLFFNDPTVDDPLITEVYEIKDENGKAVNVCDVPNIFLTETKKIKVRIPSKVTGLYGTLHSYVGVNEKYYEVEAAEKPSDYVYEETSTEGSGNISDEQIDAAVKKYLDENGTAGGEVASDEEVENLLNDIFGV